MIADNANLARPKEAREELLCAVKKTNIVEKILLSRRSAEIVNYR